VKNTFSRSLLFFAGAGLRARASRTVLREVLLSGRRLERPSEGYMSSR